MKKPSLAGTEGVIRRILNALFSPLERISLFKGLDQPGSRRSIRMHLIVGLVVVLTMVPVFAAILRVPFGIIAPIILVICAIGAYTVHNNTFDVVMMFVFGIAGYFLKKCNYPLAPLVLAIVLGDKAEESFRQSLLISQGSLGVFWSNGLVGSIMALGLVALFWPALSNLVGRFSRPALR